MISDQHKEHLLSELNFKAIRSSGSGGQHVNKVASKVELYFDLENSQVLSEDQKVRLKKTLKTRLTNDHVLLLQCGDGRSQHKNKETVIKRFLALIEEGLKVKKKRKPTKVPKSVKAKRKQHKQKLSVKKANRKKPDLE